MVICEDGNAILIKIVYYILRIIYIDLSCETK